MEKDKVVNKKELVKKLLKQEISIEDENDLIEMLIDKPITVDVDKQEDKNLTRGERLADKLSEVAGSWTFIIGFTVFILLWIIINTIYFSHIDLFQNLFNIILLQILLEELTKRPDLNAFLCSRQKKGLFISGFELLQNRQKHGR